MPPVRYADYLDLSRVLSAQHPLSEKKGAPAHDEMLFIIVHQVYELWFKQILHELDSVCTAFGRPKVDERDVGTAVARLTRVVEIQKLLIDQLRVLETMTPLDFLEFRDLLTPASGFQSLQFRLLETRLGVQGGPASESASAYHAGGLDAHGRELENEREKPSLFDLVQRWLERTPFLTLKSFDFWATYDKSVRRMLDAEEKIIRENRTLTEAERKKEQAQLNGTRENFEALLDEKHYARWGRRLSWSATRAALFIALYRDEPILHLPFRLLTLLVDVDDLFTTWRYRHVLMVERMIGSRIGTGGSSGAAYLKSTIEARKVFSDLATLSTFLVKRSELPKLPAEVERQLGFTYSGRA